MPVPVPSTAVPQPASIMPATAAASVMDRKSVVRMARSPRRGFADAFSTSRAEADGSDADARLRRRSCIAGDTAVAEALR